MNIWTDVPVRGMEQDLATSMCSLQPNWRFSKFHAPHCFQGDNEARSENNEAVDVSEWSGWFRVVLAQEYGKHLHHCESQSALSLSLMLNSIYSEPKTHNPSNLQRNAMLNWTMVAWWPFQSSVGRKIHHINTSRHPSESHPASYIGSLKEPTFPTPPPHPFRIGGIFFFFYHPCCSGGGVFFFCLFSSWLSRTEVMQNIKHMLLPKL